MKAALWGVGGVVLLILVWVGVTAAGVASEASKMEALLKDQMKQHVDVATLKAKLAGEGYTVTTDGPPLKADGPRRSLLVTSVGLTLSAEFDGDGKMKGYHLDRG
jgi:hypothetical protein